MRKRNIMGNITEEITEEVMGKEVIMQSTAMDMVMGIMETRDIMLFTVSTMIPGMAEGTAMERSELEREALIS